jgi:uncharacterized protein
MLPETAQRNGDFMNMNGHFVLDVFVFARSPVLGKVKRRLAEAIGETRALAIQRKLLRHLLRVVSKTHEEYPFLRPVLFHLGPQPKADLVSSFNGRLMAQPHEEMAANLAFAVSAPQTPERDGVIVIGADHPMIEPNHILSMARLVAQYPVALGPAEDGGFWALATTVPLDGIVRGLPLGTAMVFKKLLESVERAGLAYGIGPVLWDVDTVADLERWKLAIKQRAVR